jgi:hypothetical protein
MTPETTLCPPRDITRLAFSITNEPLHLLKRLGQVLPSADVEARERAAAALRANGDTAWAYAERVSAMADAMTEMCIITESDAGLIGCPIEEAYVRDRYREYFMAFGLAFLSILDEDDLLDSGKNL